MALSFVLPHTAYQHSAVLTLSSQIVANLKMRFSRVCFLFFFNRLAIKSKLVSSHFINKNILFMPVSG